ncbi:MAG: hypothetical protein M3299_03605 [Thermoproteota archaeon]|nr:hypothetical protein [Thermoproteota archaeon]
MFLSRTELDYLTSKRQFGDDYGYTIKCRLQKKLQQFTSQELPILLQKGYLTEFRKPDLTENCKIQNGPGEIRTPAPRHVKAH